MDSLAAYLAILAGGGSQGGQKAAPASAPGASGLFAALLQAGGRGQAENGDNALPLTPFAPQPSGTGAQASTALVPGDALTRGLGSQQAPGDVAAAIVEGNGEAPQPGGIPSQVAGAPVVLPQAHTAVAVAAQTLAPEADGAAPAQSAPRSPPVSGPAQAQGTPVGQTAAATLVQGAQAPTETAAPAAGSVPAKPATAAEQPEQPGPAPQADGDGQTRPSGLENALQRAAPPARETGLQTAMVRSAQSQTGGAATTPAPVQQARLSGEVRATGEARMSGGSLQSTVTAGAPATNVPRAPGTDTPRPSVTGSAAAAAAVKPGTERPQFAPPRAPEIIKRIVNPGSGHSLIRIQEHSGGETSGPSSPPTLTVSVQAPAASPGPAQASAPHVPVGALAVHIAQQAHNGARRFDIRLDPPELGRIEVRLDVSRDGKVTTHLVVERSETLDLLQRDARHLERALQDAGLNTSQDGMKFSLKDQGLPRGHEDPAGAHGEPDSRDASGDDDGGAPASEAAMPRGGRYTATSGLDIRI